MSGACGGSTDAMASAGGAHGGSHVAGWAKGGLIHGSDRVREVRARRTAPTRPTRRARGNQPHGCTLDVPGYTYTLCWTRWRPSCAWRCAPANSSVRVSLLLLSGDGRVISAVFPSGLPRLTCDCSGVACSGARRCQSPILSHCAFSEIHALAVRTLSTSSLMPSIGTNWHSLT